MTLRTKLCARGIEHRLRLFSQCQSVHRNSLLPPVPRQFPDEALASEFAVELGIKALTTGIEVEALTALLTKCRFMLLADGDRFSILVVLTSQFPSPMY